jgi:hypothetical protein
MAYVAGDISSEAGYAEQRANIAGLEMPGMPQRQRKRAAAAAAL